MAETINTNVFDSNKKFVDFSGLDYFWGKAKTYIDGVDATMSAKVVANEQAIQAINDELNSLSGGAGSIQTQINNAISALDLPNTYEAKGEAAQALVDAKAYADGKDSAMDTRVKVLEGIDHDQLAADAAASVVATILDGAPEKFDTLKEVADWIASSESADSAADLVTRVSALEAIDHEAYVAADALKSYYSKTEVDNLLSTNSTGDRAYAKQYTDELFGSFQFAANSDIDALFAPKA